MLGDGFRERPSSSLDLGRIRAMFRSCERIERRTEQQVPATMEAQTDASLRLRPEMASRRLLVLAFVRDYINRWGQSPSYGEISNGLAISPTRARQLVKTLVAGGQLTRSPGPRGLSLPTLRDEAIRQLRELGWSVDEDTLRVAAPCAHSTLRRPILIDYLDGRTVEQDAGQSSGSGSNEPSGAAAGTAGRASDASSA